MQENGTESRVIALTGATRGLGRALLERFVAAGHRVAGCGRTEGALVELRERHGERVRLEALDVSDATAVARWAERIVGELGAPDLLVNNASLMNDLRPLWEVPAEEFEALLAVNVMGTANTIRAFVPGMIARGSGVVVNLSSGWGRSTSPEVGPYCTTKWAIEGLTRSLAQELPAGLAAVALNPGTVDTDMLRQCWSDGAGGHEGPEAWSERAAPFLLGLGPRDNGRALDVP